LRFPLTSRFVVVLSPALSTPKAAKVLAMWLTMKKPLYGKRELISQTRIFSDVSPVVEINLSIR